MTDIVERLKNLWIEQEPKLTWLQMQAVTDEAADEIERLREALKRAADRDEERRRPIRLIGSEAAARKALGETDE